MSTNSRRCSGKIDSVRKYTSAGVSGLVGFWNIDGEAADSALFSRLIASVRHRGPDGAGEHVDGPVAFGCQHLWVTPEEIGEKQPLVSASGVMLVMDGRLDNRDELLPALELPAGVSDAACVRAAYQRWGDQFAGRLAGDFAIAIFDRSKQQLLLVRDAIGVRPLYYYRDQHFVAFASEIKALLAHPKVPRRADEAGLADFLLLGARPVDGQETTCFAGISALVPAHQAAITPDGVSIRRYWDFDTGRTIRLRSFEEYAEAFQQHFAEAVRRRMRSAYPVAVSVSGGLDSSSIFCQAETLRRSGAGACPALIGVSYTGTEGTDADEVRYLLDIEREYGVEIDRFPIEPLLGMVRRAEEQIETIEAPFLDYLWGVTSELRRRASASGARTLIAGHWGDQMLFSADYLIDLFGRLAWGDVRRHMHEYERWFGASESRIMRRRFTNGLVRHHLPRALLPPLKWLKRKFSGPLRPPAWFSERFVGQARRFANQPATLGANFHSAHARSIYLEARSKYHVHCMDWNNKVAARHQLDAVFPFLDRDLIAFLMAIPGEVENRNGVPRALPREAMRGVLPESVRQRTWKADFGDVVNRGIAGDLPQITHALSGESAAVRLGYVERGPLDRALAQLNSSNLSGQNCTAAWELGDLVGLETWLQVFLGQPSPHRGSYGPTA
jgi:asparagine synthase (glutamine-hydrolysing)